MPNTNPITTPLGIDLFEEWNDGNTIFADGEASGVGKERGYNYLNEAINNAQKALTEVGNAFETVPTKNSDGVVAHEYFPPLDYQLKTQDLPNTLSLALEDSIPFYDEATGVNRRIDIWGLREAFGIESPSIEVLASANMQITITDGTTTYTGQGSGTYPLPQSGTWTVTGTNGSTVTKVVEVTSALVYVVDLRVIVRIEIGHEPFRSNYINKTNIDTYGAVILAVYEDGSNSDITHLCSYSPTIADDGGAATVPVNKTVIFTYQDALVRDYTAEWTIVVDRIPIPMPSQSGIPAYNGSVRTPTILNLPDPVEAIRSGQQSATNAGTYYYTFTPTPTYKWQNNSTQAYDMPWSISGAVIDQLPVWRQTIRYNGAQFNGSTPNYWTPALTSNILVSGTKLASNAGSYTVTFTPQANYQWWDGTTTAKNATWSILNAQITAIPSQSNTLRYTGAVQSPTWNNYDQNKMILGGVTSGTAVGSYNATFTPKANYEWSDGTTTAKTVSWSIGVALLVVPTQAGSLTYSGTSQSPSWNNYDTSKMTIGGIYSSTNAGTFTATFTPKTGFAWQDNTTTAKNVTWSIGRASISVIPSQSTTVRYTGSAVTPTWANYNTSQLTIGGATSGTNVSIYTATFTPTGNYQWSDGTIVAKSVQWQISRGIINTIPTQSGSLVYNGAARTPTWSNYNTSQLTISGTTSSVNAGTFSATFTPTSNWQWSDNTTTGKVVTWQITKQVIALPYQSNTLTYNGSIQYPTFTFNSNIISIGAVSGQTNAGTYSVSFALVGSSATNYMWPDNTTTTKSIPWVINKAARVLTIVGGAPETTTSGLTITKEYTMNTAAELSSTSLNTWSANTNIVRVSGTSPITPWAKQVSYIGGNTTGSVNTAVSLAETTNYAQSNVIEGYISNRPIYSDLANNPWEVISYVSKAGTASNYWSIGAEKSFTMTTGETITMQIYGFNHDVANSITFGTKNLMANLQRMNSSMTNSGGFRGSAMYTWLQGSLYNSFPDELKTIIRAVDKITSAGNGSASLVTDTMKVFLFSEIECFGANTYSYAGEGTKYSIFTNNSSRIKYLANGSGTPSHWWQRSPPAGYSTAFCFTSNNGTTNLTGANSSIGVCFGFCV